MLLSEIARDRGIRYFLISFTDLFGTQRAKMVPAQAIDRMAVDGAGFAGFAAWLDMTPADPDILAMPDTSQMIQLPWQPDVAWLPADVMTIDRQPLTQTPRLVLKRVLEQATARGYRVKTGVECEYFLLSAAGDRVFDGLDRSILTSGSMPLSPHRELLGRRMALAMLATIAPIRSGFPMPDDLNFG
jgi:glutamate---methylamine ligase